MKRALVAGIGLVLAALVAWAVLRVPAGPTTAPDFVLPDLDNQVVRMRDLRGKVVVLNLWATWCLPCVQEMPTLQELAEKLGGRDFAVLAVSQDEVPEKVGPWVRERGLTFPVLLDPRGEVGYALGVTGYPETFIVDRSGEIVHHHVGYRDWAEPQIVRALERLLETGQWIL